MILPKKLNTKIIQNNRKKLILTAFSERRKRQRVEDSMSRRREFQERIVGSSVASRYRTSRQSTDTGVSTIMK